MQATAKLFNSGNSQAVRLPKAFRMPGDAVWIQRDEATGDIILRAKNDDQRARNLEELLQLIRENKLTEDFIPPRDDAPSPSPFEDWEASEEPEMPEMPAADTAADPGAAS